MRYDNHQFNSIVLVDTHIFFPVTSELRKRTSYENHSYHFGAMRRYLLGEKIVEIHCVNFIIIKSFLRKYFFYYKSLHMQNRSQSQKRNQMLYPGKYVETIRILNKKTQLSLKKHIWKKKCSKRIKVLTNIQTFGLFK